MIVLLDTSDAMQECQRDLGDVRIGQLVTPSTGRTLQPDVPFAIDNGAFGKDGFEADRFIAILERDKAHQARCLFVCCPDVVGSARRTSEVFDRWHTRLGAWKVALVAQDGIENMEVPWDRLDALFIGGSTRFKTSDAAQQVGRAARLLGKWVHVGRVNTPERFDAWEWADSCDGTGVGRYSHMRRSLTSAAPLFVAPGPSPQSGPMSGEK